MKKQWKNLFSYVKGKLFLNVKQNETIMIAFSNLFAPNPFPLQRKCKKNLTNYFCKQNIDLAPKILLYSYEIKRTCTIMFCIKRFSTSFSYFSIISSCIWKKIHATKNKENQKYIVLSHSNLRPHKYVSVYLKSNFQQRVNQNLTAYENGPYLACRWEVLHTKTY